MQQLPTPCSAARISNKGCRPSGEELAALQNQDPFGFAAGDANLQRYVGNDPTNVTDPSGLAETQSASVQLPGKAGETKIVASAVYGKYIARLGIHEIGDMSAGAKPVTLTAAELGRLEAKNKELLKKDPDDVPPTRAIVDGISLKITADFSDPTMKGQYFWNQKYGVTAEGTNTANLPRKLGDDITFRYPGQKATTKGIELVDAPGFKQEVAPYPRLTFDGKKKTLTFLPIANKANMEKEIQQFWDKEGTNKTKLTFTFVDTLYKGEKTPVGNWTWTFTIDYNNKAGAKFKPTIDISKPKWTHAGG